MTCHKARAVRCLAERFTDAGKSDEPDGPGYRRALTKVYLENGSEVDAHIYELS